ncbi:MAG TPA: MBL fold metallo-hydrolase, partial [Conexibacter sp.]|nr:MBL fold metallo-hydrolase [Conexibacter sp.]
RTLAGSATTAVVPRGSRRLLQRLAFDTVHELAAGERARIAAAEIEAVPAWHPTRRWPRRTDYDALGFLVERVWFAGDTDLDPAMEELRGRVDVALVPIWGWGPSLGPGHLDPASAARAVALVAPEVVVPIHWGTLLPLGTRWRHGEALSAPAHAFAAQVGRAAPSVRVATLAVGEALSL